MNLNRAHLLHHYLTLSARVYPDKCALVSGLERWTYAELDEVTDNLSSALNNIGLQKGERVLIILDNCPEAVIAFYGVLKAGGISVLLNGSIKAPKLAYILNDASPTLIVAHVKKSDVIEKAFKITKKEIGTIWIGEMDDDESPLSIDYNWNDIAMPGGANPFSPLYRPCSYNSRITDRQDLAALIYTSGSTGEPKGIMASHKKMIVAADSIIEYLENRPEDIVIVTLPLSFDYGLYQVIMAFMYGGTIVLERSFLYPVSILESIERERVTGFPLVPTSVALLLKIEDFSDFDLSSLRYATNTGAALPVNHISRLRQLLPGVRLYSMYGLTECKRVSYLNPDDLDGRPNSVGKPMSCCEVFIVDEVENEVASGVVGELVVRGANVMEGYWNDPALTAKMFREWKFPGEKVLFTGDFFKQDEEGFLYFQGRMDEMIKTRGERIFPREIENTLHNIAGIDEAAVVALDDSTIGKSLCAFIIREEGCTFNERDVLKFCNEVLEYFFVPGSIIFINEMPKTPNGKVDKNALAALASERAKKHTGSMIKREFFQMTENMEKGHS